MSWSGVDYAVLAALNAKVLRADANCATKAHDRNKAVADHPTHLPLADLTSIRCLCDREKTAASIESGRQITVGRRIDRAVGARIVIATIRWIHAARLATASGTHRDHAASLVERRGAPSFCSTQASRSGGP